MLTVARAVMVGTVTHHWPLRMRADRVVAAAEVVMPLVPEPAVPAAMAVGQALASAAKVPPGCQEPPVVTAVTGEPVAIPWVALAVPAVTREPVA